MKPANRIRIDYADNDIKARVSTFLKSRHFPAFRNLSVDVNHGSVTLSGNVDSFYEKQVALTTCQRVAGVLSLIDEVAVNLRETPASAEQIEVRPR